MVSSCGTCTAPRTCGGGGTPNVCGGGACVTAPGTGAWTNTAFATQTGTSTARFDATPSASPTNTVVGLSSGAQTLYSAFAALARFNPSGDVDAYNGTTALYAAATVVPYSANETYNFRLVFNVPAQTYSIYVTPPGASEQTIGINYGFRAKPSSLSSWGASTHSGNAATTVCNFALQ